MKISGIRAGFSLVVTLMLNGLAFSQSCSLTCASSACGQVNVGFSPSGGVDFCENSIITFENTSSTMFTYYVINWSDGTIDTVYNQSNVTHQYSVDDSLLCDGDILYEVCFQGVLECNGGMSESCASGSYVFNLRVRPKAIILTEAQQCITDPVAFINGSCNGDTYLWDFGDGMIPMDEDPVHSYNAPGTYTVSLIAMNECGADTTDQVIQIVSEPFAEVQLAPVDSAVCLNHVSTFTDITSTAGTTVWSITPNDTTLWSFTDTLMNLHSDVIEVLFKEVGQYTITLTATNACGVHTSIQNIEVFAEPAVSLNAGPVLCISEPIYNPDVIYTGEDQIISYFWSFDGGVPATSIDAYPSGVIFNSVGSHSVSLLIVSECGNTTVNTIVQVDDLPDILMPMIDPVYCSGSDPDTLMANPDGGSWAGNGISIDGIFDPGDAGVGTYVFIYTVGVGTCESSDSISTTVVASTSVEVHDTTVCQDAQSFFLYAHPTGGVWSGVGIIDPLGVFDPQSSGTGMFSPIYEYEDQQGCTINSTASVSVSELPAVAIEDSIILCNQDFDNQLQSVLSLTTDPAGGMIGWNVNGTQSNGLFNANGLNGFHFVEVEYSLNACIVRDSGVIEVVSPQQIVISPDDTVCISEVTHSLVSNLNPGIWQGPGVNPSTGIISLALAGAGTHTYTFVYLEGTSCEQRDSVRVTINDPGMNLDAGQDISLCASAVLSYTLNGTPEGGMWSGPEVSDPMQGQINIAALALDVPHRYMYCLSDQAVDGCSACDSLTLVVHSLPDAGFQIEGNICVNEEFVTIADSCVGSHIYSWDFGNSGNASGCSTPFFYSTPGDFLIVLVVDAEYGCVDSFSLPVHVTAPPVPNFDVETMEGCAPLVVNVTNTSIGEISEYSWVVTGDTIQNQHPAPFVFDGITHDSVFTIQLIGSNLCASVSKSMDVLVHPYPTAYFGFNVDDGCSPLLIEFGNATIGGPEAWYWDLGDGTISLDSVPSPHTYVTPLDSVSIYTVQLIASNMCGSDTLYRQITVYPPDVRAFIELDTSLGCEPLQINPTSLSTQGSLLFWQVLGPTGQVTGSDSVISPEFLLEMPGIYSVVLTAARCGADSDTSTVEVLAAPTVLFESDHQVCLRDTVHFTNLSQGISSSQWNFGDGGSSILFSPEHVYINPGIYTVILSASSSTNGCQNSHESTIEIVGLPGLFIDTSALSGCEPYYAEFQNSGDSDLTYIWNFHDGSPEAITYAPEHVFKDPGSYVVQVFAVDGNECKSDTKLVVVNVWPLPVPDIDFVKSQECGVPSIVQFNNQTIGAITYEWDFGDGAQSSQMHPQHAYDTDGNFIVTMTSTSARGCVDSQSVNVPIYLQPESAFTLISPVACEDAPVEISNESIHAQEYCWFLDNKLISQESLPFLVIDSPGVYTITLITKYNQLCQDTLSLIDGIEIFTSPTADFDFVVDQDVNILGDVHFMNQSEKFDRLFWNFGDGSTSDEVDPWHEYDINRSIQVSLIAYAEHRDMLTCTDTVTKLIDPEWLTSFYAPNAFSPDHGEELVRLFKPVGIGLREYEMSVFSPWGQQVWHSTLLENTSPVEGWNGRLENTGEELPQGAFTWMVRITFVNGHSIVQSGSVTLLR